MVSSLEICKGTPKKLIITFKNYFDMYTGTKNILTFQITLNVNRIFQKYCAIFLTLLSYEFCYVYPY